MADVECPRRWEKGYSVPVSVAGDIPPSEGGGLEDSFFGVVHVDDYGLMKVKHGDW